MCVCVDVLKKKFVDICYTIVHGKIGSWNKHVNMFPIDLITKL